MFHTYKIRIYPSDEQEKVLWDLSEKCRLLYNFALQERRENWNENKDLSKEEREYIKYKDQQNQLPALKRKYPEYGWVYSKVLQMTLKKLDGAYKSLFTLIKNGDKTVRPPKFRGKEFFFTLCYNQSGFNFHEGHTVLSTENLVEFAYQFGSICLSHKHPSKIDLSFQLTFKPKGKIKQVEIFQDYKERWFLALNCEISPYKPYSDNGLYQAIDLGITNIISAVNLQSKFIQIKNKRPDLYWRRKIAEVQSKRDRCKKKSNRWHWYNRKLGKMIRKQSNQLKDFQHKISKVIVNHTKANTLIVGDLAVKQMVRKKKRKYQKTLNYSLQNTGYLGRFVQFLTYKADKVGKKVVKIDEKNTTKTCCLCGSIKDRKLSERTIKCDCGNQMDRDLNSAVNIMSRFLQMKNQFGYLLHQSSVNEESFLHKWKGFLRHIANSKTPVSSSTSMGFSGLVGSHLR